MRSDAYIRVGCDRCPDAEIEINLTALAGGGYDERNVAQRLEMEEWVVRDGVDICYTCAAEEDEGADRHEEQLAEEEEVQAALEKLADEHRFDGGE